MPIAAEVVLDAFADTVVSAKRRRRADGGGSFWTARIAKKIGLHRPKKMVPVATTGLGAP
jgi:hypothetical protein